MSGFVKNLFGGPSLAAAGAGPFQGIQVQTSISTRPIPIVYGQQRLSPNLIWYNDFKQTGSASGGKGGGGKMAGGDTYSAAIIMGLCEGTINDVVAVWKNNTYEQISASGWSAVTGGGATGAMCSFSGNVMTCTVAPSTGNFSLGQTISATGVGTGRTIESFSTGTGGTGIYTITPEQIATSALNAVSGESASGAYSTFSGTTMYCVVAPTGGYFVPGQVVTAAGLPIGTTISSYGSGVTPYTNNEGLMVGGKEGNYNLSAAYIGSTVAATATNGIQSPWVYVVTKHPTEARGYPNTACIRAANYALDASAQLPNHSFEVAGILQFTANCGQKMANSIPTKWVATTGYTTNQIVYAPQGGAYIATAPSTNKQPPNITYWTEIFPDANPAVMLSDIITNTTYGASFPAAYIDSVSGAQYSNYCIAMGLFLSHTIQSQEAANSIINRTMEITNSEVFWSDGLLKVVPRGDTVVTGNGVTFTPNLTPEYDLTDDNFIADSGSAPVRLAVSDVVDAFNVVTVNFNNRLNHYNQQPIQVKDQSSIDLYGLRPESAQSYQEICDPIIATKVAQLRLQRIQKGRNVYQFTLGITFCPLEPMDIVTLTDSGLGLDLTAVRITSVEEDEFGNLSFTAEELLAGAAHPALFPAPQQLGYSADYNLAPPNTNTPIFYVPSTELAGNKLVGYLLASGGTGWGGCQVWISNDGVTYKYAGKIDGGSPMGVLTANIAAGDNPDTTNTLSIDLTSSNGTLISVTQHDADVNNTLCYVDGELMSFETAILTAANKYTLSYLPRGQYGSVISPHLIGSPFAAINGNQFELNFTSEQIGGTLYVKLPSFNYWGAGQQDIANVSATTFTITAPARPSTAHPFSARIGLPAPSSVKVFASPDMNGLVSKVRVQFNLSIVALIPDTFYIMLSITETANQFSIGVDNNTSIDLNLVPENFLSTTIAIPGSNLVLSTPFHAVTGSTMIYLKVAEAPLPVSFNLGGHYWAQFGTSQWRKVTSYDVNGFYFNQPFDVAPVDGDVINYVELSWSDERDAEYRLAAIQLGAQTEICRWTSIHQVGGTFSITGITRAQEGTSKIADASGGTFTYYPAPGNGTQLISFNSATRNADGSYTCETAVSISVLREAFVSMSAGVTLNTTGGLLRSPIVPAVYGGPL